MDWTLIFSAIAAIAAIVAAVFPIWQFLKTSRKADVQAFLEQGRTRLGKGGYDLVVRNAGAIDVYEVRVEAKSRNHLIDAEKCDLLSKTIPSLLQQSELRAVYTRGFVTPKNKMQGNVVFTVFYKSNQKRKKIKMQSYVVDLDLLQASWVDMSDPETRRLRSEVSSLQEANRANKAAASKAVKEVDRVLRNLR